MQNRQNVKCFANASAVAKQNLLVTNAKCFGSASGQRMVVRYLVSNSESAPDSNVQKSNVQLANRMPRLQILYLNAVACVTNPKWSKECGKFDLIKKD